MKSLIRMVCLAVMLIAAGQTQAGMIITYRDVGSDLQFDYSGSLDVVAFSNLSTTQTLFATVSQFNAISSPLFYSAGGSTSYSFAGRDSSVTHSPGSFATNLPDFNASSVIQGTSTGTAFLFRLNGGAAGPATSVDLFGNWGAANTQINGQLIITGQSAAGIGMVDGWSLQTDWGSITFQDAGVVAAVPEPASMAIWGMGALGMGFVVRRKKRLAA